MTFTLLNPTPIRQTDANGLVAAGAKLYTYAAGTTTPQASYTDATGTTPLSNPVVADGTGLFPEIWLSPLAYDLACYTSTGTLLWTASGIAPTSTTSGYTPLSVTGTDTIVGTFSPGISSYVAGQQFQFQAAGNNTTTSVTINVSGLGPQPIKNPDGSNLAAGAIKGGQLVQLYYTGSFFQYVNFVAKGGLIGVQTFTSSGTYTPSAGVNSVLVIAVGGGGSGGSAGLVNVAGNAACSSGGQAGGFAIGIFTIAQIGASNAVTIGAGGTAPASASNPGNPGGDTSLGSLITAKGGAGGASSLLAATGYLDGGHSSTAGSGGFLNIAGQPGEFAFWPTSSWGFGGAGGNSIYGAGGRKVANLTASSAVAGNNGSGYGSGGGGAVALGSNGGPVSGGNGASGILIVYEYS